jgi:hypothetical protein
MADIKISALVELTSAAVGDYLPIVDISETVTDKTKRITVANLKTGLGVTVGASIMTGNTLTIAWFYLNTAPPGWVVQATGADTVIGVAGGSYSFNVSGGNPDSSATWVITGLTADSHAHTVSSHAHAAGAHLHPVYDYRDSDNSAYYDESGVQQYITYSSRGYVGLVVTATAASSSLAHDLNTGAGSGDTGYASPNTGAASASGVTAAGTWRPKASIGKLFKMDV